MPYRPKGKHPGIGDKKNSSKNPSSQRSRCAGAEDKAGKFQSAFDLHLMEKQGCDLEKAFGGE